MCAGVRIWSAARQGDPHVWHDDGELLELGDWLSEKGSPTWLSRARVYWRPVVRREALFDREGMKGPLLQTVAAVR